MRFYGLTDYRLGEGGEAIELYDTLVEAEQAVRDVVNDEPEWAGFIGVEVIEFDVSLS